MGEPPAPRCGIINFVERLQIYVDSSVWNFRFNEYAPDLQAQTRRFFDRLKSEGAATAYVSDVVLEELGQARGKRASQLAGLLRKVAPTVLEFNDEAAALAEAYVVHGVLTSGHLVDARHVAVATVAQVDALVSWNYDHLVNRRRRDAFNGVNIILGYRPIDVITPPEVFDD
jgi:predicted nucleic acid-binding protein